MSRACWWLANLMSRVLDPDEREAVHGDLAESREGAGRALGGVLGLVARRQFALWKDWRPWLAFVSLVVPLGLLLGLNSVSISRSYDLHLWIIRNYKVIDPGILHQTGLWSGRGNFDLVRHSLLLVCWSGSGGFVLGALSRRATPVNGALFCLMLLLGEVAAAPKYHYYVAGAAYAKSLSTVLQPLILLVMLVMLPAVWGMYQGERRLR